jgi:hypothetical protein
VHAGPLNLANLLSFANRTSRFVGNLRNQWSGVRLPENAAGTYNSVGSTESVYLTCLDNAAKRDLPCSLSFPNRISLSRSTNAKVSDKYPLAIAEGV